MVTDSIPSEAELRQALTDNPEDYEANREMSRLMLARGLCYDAEKYAVQAIKIKPDYFEGYDLLGHVLCGSGRPNLAETYFMRAITMSGDKVSFNTYLRYALCLRDQGKFDGAREVYHIAMKIDSLPASALIEWAQMEEDDKAFQAALILLNEIEAGNKDVDNYDYKIARCRIYLRMGKHKKAKEVFAIDDNSLSFYGLSDKGRLLAQMGEHDAAWGLWQDGKQAFMLQTGYSYQDATAANMIGRIKDFFITERIERLPLAEYLSTCPQPLFIFGFPRSGTTLLEQMLSSHPNIVAGGELRIVQEVNNLMPLLIDSAMSYPEAVSDLQMPHKRVLIESLRDHYLEHVRKMRIWHDNSSWFTDKMPLNEVHTGIIRMMFPLSPMIYMVRHPLDVVVSAFANHMNHDWFCCTELETIAKHYVRVNDLVHHYINQLQGHSKLTFLKYEVLVQHPKNIITNALAMAGLEFDPACLNFHENKHYTMTASRSQVTQPLYDTSIGRYKHYLKQLAPIIEILKPIMDRYEYDYT